MTRDGAANSGGATTLAVLVVRFLLRRFFLVSLSLTSLSGRGSLVDPGVSPLLSKTGMGKLKPLPRSQAFDTPESTLSDLCVFASM